MWMVTEILDMEVSNNLFLYKQDIPVLTKNTVRLQLTLLMQLRELKEIPIQAWHYI